MNNESQEKQNEEESFTKTSNNIEAQIENIKKEYEFQNQQKNQELEALFEEVNNENQELKKELLQTKFDLEEEKQKLKNIKNTFININAGNISSFLQEEINTDTFDIERNYIYLNDHIRIIKENSEKKISELNYNHDNKIKNFFEEKKSFLQNLQKILEIKRDNNDWVKDIIELNEKFFADIELLLNDNFNKDKYIIAQGEKYEIMKEEIKFIKERIFLEKKNILEKIQEINGINKLNYFNLIQELQTELEENNKNFYSEQIMGPSGNLNLMIANIKKNEQQLESNRYKLECENEILKNKINILEQEKNELLNKSSNFIFDKESIISENMIYKSEINKLKNEIQIISNENNSLLKNIKELNEELLNIKNKNNLDLKKIENNNKLIITQKESLIQELSNKNNSLIQNDVELKNKLENLNEQIINLQQELSQEKEKDNAYQKEISELNKKLNEDLLTSKDVLQRHSATEEINKNLSEKIELLQSEKKNIENASNIINNKYNNINIEYNKIKTELDEQIKKNNLIEKEMLQLNNKLNTMQSNYNLLQTESDLLHKIQQSIKEIYQLHFTNNNNNNQKNKEQNNPDELLIMLNNINEKLSQRNSSKNMQGIINNPEFNYLENNKNSQLYENILLYLINIESKNKIELAKIITEKNSNIISNNNSGEISQSMTHNSSNNFFNKKNFDELKFVLEDKYKKIEERIRTSITIGEFEELIYKFKNSYEAVIDSIIKSFYIYKSDLSEINILTIQMPLNKYDQIINNTNSNLILIEKSIIKKINEYKNQGETIESAMSILIKNVHMIYN